MGRIAALFLIAILVILAAAPDGQAETALPGAVPAEADPPLTVVVTRFAKRGCEAAFEAAWDHTFRVRNAFSGHLLTDFIRPSNPRDTGYHMIFKFDRTSNYQAWVKSPERATWLQRMDALTEGAPHYQIQPGLEAWVTLPDVGGAIGPDKYKTATVTWLAIFPLVAAINASVGPAIATAPFLVRNLIVTALVVPAMTWIVMPPMTQWFRDWLYPAAPECAG